MLTNGARSVGKIAAKRKKYNMTTWREFRFVRDGKADLIWKIAQTGDSYKTQHGQAEGSFQEFSDTPGTKGTEGTAAFVSAEDNCAFNIDREIRKKTENGYIEYENGKPLTQQVTGLDFNKPLPKCFSSYKPQTSIEPKALEKLHKAKLDRYSRKYDGCCHVLTHHTNGWEVYTRRMDKVTAKFPELIDQLNQLKQFGAGTIIVGELICLKSNGVDDFKSVSRFCRSDPDEARRLVTHGEIHEPIFIMFDTLFHNGKDLSNKSYDERSKLLKTLPPLQQVIDYELATSEKPFYTNKFRIVSVDYFDLAPDTWEAFAKEKGWEGFVVTDGSAKPGNKFYSFNGKANRPKGHHKLKPSYTEEIVAYVGFKGGGKRLGGIGSVFTKQIHPDTGKFFDTGKMGSGFTEADLAEIEKIWETMGLPIVEKEKEALKYLNDNNGIVMELEYSERQPGTNKFRFPVFMRIRTDKGIEECEAQRLAPDDE
jgi:ATP-dependent DNA ligase